jgi:excisionase family DNA binding protein
MKRKMIGDMRKKVEKSLTDLNTPEDGLSKESTKRAFTISEAAEYACVSRGTVDHWLAKRLLPFEELPCTGTIQRLRRIRKKDLDEFLERNLVHTPEPPQKVKQSHTGLYLIPKNA